MGFPLYSLQCLNFRFGNILDPWEMPSNSHITAHISHRVKVHEKTVLQARQKDTLNNKG